jgi:hypothetical protein
MYDQVFHLEEGFTPETWAGAPYPHCGSRDVVSELRHNLDAELNPLGISYKAFAPYVELRSSARILTVAAGQSSGHS